MERARRFAVFDCRGSEEKANKILRHHRATTSTLSVRRAHSAARVHLQLFDRHNKAGDSVSLESFFDDIT